MNDTLATLLAQAESQRNRALAAYNDARARRDAARRQAADLALYRSDYQQRWQVQFRRAVAHDIARCYREFAARLELAIAQQAQALQGWDAALAHAEHDLSAHELRVASVRRLIERRVAEQQRVQERREQQACDEQALRMRRTTHPSHTAAMPALDR